MNTNISEIISMKAGMKSILRGCRILYKMAPSYYILTVISSFINALRPFVSLLFSALILNELSGRRNIHTIVLYVILTVLATFILSILALILAKKLAIINSTIFDRQALLLSEHFTTLDYKHVENNRVNELLADIAAKTNSNGLGLMRLYWNIPGILQGVLGIILSCALLAGMFKASSQYKKSFITSNYAVVLLVIFIAFILYFTVFLGRIEKEKLKNIFENQGKSNTLVNYYYNYSTVGNAGKEIRMYNQKYLLMEVINKWAQDSRFVHYFKIFGTTQGLAAAVNALFSGFVYLFIGLRALVGMYSIGSVVQYVGAVTNLTNNLTWFISTCNQIWMNIPYLNLLYEYLDLPNEKYQGSLTVEKRCDNEYEIEFHNVSFQYPGTTNYALKNLNLRINIGKRMAVVGMNGSGKTTMIKLLCRLYDPTEGVITLNGIDIRKYDYDEYMLIFSVVFQDFKLFSFDIGQNVAAKVDYDNQKLIDSLGKAGLADRLATMPKGLDTPLYKDFEEDGVEISGGEAQKAALARALYKDAPFIVLDEPTAALDPIAEYEIYSRFNEIIGDKTAIYISHRLSSCRFCDDIVVFHEGELIQRGSHDALVTDTGGKYFELWTAQAQYYAAS